MSRILGIDFGSRRIGVALSDETQSIALPYETVGNETDLLQLIRGVESLERIVVGLPLNMDGTAGEKAGEALAFKERLESATQLPVDTFDERLSSVQAERALSAGGFRGRKRKERTDRVAAQIILQAYLDARRASAAGEEAHESASDP